MIIFRNPFTALLILLGISQASVAQTQIATGAQPFGSFTPTSFERFDNGSLNMHFEIPIAAKSGRGMPFTYSLAYDSSVWSPTSSSGTSAWTPQATWGWSAITQAALGYVSFTFMTGTSPCQGGTAYWGMASSFVYHDAFGASHAFDGSTFLTQVLAVRLLWRSTRSPRTDPAIN